MTICGISWATCRLVSLMRNMHRLGAEAMVLVVALHMLQDVYNGQLQKAAPIYLGHWRYFARFTAVAQLLAVICCPGIS